MRESEKTFTWIVKLRSRRETESSQAKTGRRMQAKERAWGKPASARSQPRPGVEAAQDSCSGAPGRSQDSGLQEPFLTYLRNVLYPKGLRSHCRVLRRELT